MPDYNSTITGDHQFFQLDRPHNVTTIRTLITDPQSVLGLPVWNSFLQEIALGSGMKSIVYMFQYDNANITSEIRIMGIYGRPLLTVSIPRPPLRGIMAGGAVTPAAESNIANLHETFAKPPTTAISPAAVNPLTTVSPTVIYAKADSAGDSIRLHLDLNDGTGDIFTNIATIISNPNDFCFKVNQAGLTYDPGTVATNTLGAVEVLSNINEDQFDMMFTTDIAQIPTEASCAALGLCYDPCGNGTAKLVGTVGGVKQYQIHNVSATPWCKKCIS